ncbi:MAG: hypothetical protein ACLRTR_07225 [Clostridia bacterium]
MIIEDLAKNMMQYYVAIGANIPAKMNVEGENLNGVYGGNYFTEHSKYPKRILERSAAAIGGG